MLNQKRLKELLQYDLDTGVFTWKVRAATNTKIGSEAGSVVKDTRTYYRFIMISNKSYYAHRLAWLYVHGKWPKNQIDHEDGNGLHNWIKNLRDVTNRENSMNSRMFSNNTSGFSGVSYHKRDGNWRAYISVDSKQKHLGNFDNIDEAVSARKAAEVKYGFHPNHGQARTQ